MKTLFLAVAAAATVAALQPAGAQSSTDCMSMLPNAIGTQLSSQGIDTTNLCKLSLSDLVTIKTLLDTEGMNNNTVQKIQGLLSAAG
jgi:hypothetical protein